MLGSEYRFWKQSTLNSYSQVFFSSNPWFALILFGITFLNPSVGISGLVVILITNGLARWFGFDTELIRRGDYSFNGLLVGLGLGTYYDLTIPFIVLLVNAALITLLLTVLISGVLYKYRLPYLSIPFLLSFWLILLASRQFQSLGISERGVFVLNELYATGSTWLVNTYHALQGLPIHESILIYLKSLGAIFFQFNIVSGLLVAVGLIIYSRIAFSTSLISFYGAYLFYQFIGAEITDLSYSYIGFNFILSGIAIGAFFLIPSYASYLWSLLLIPAMVILTSSLGNLFAPLQLGIYSLPFNMVVISFIYLMNVRKRTMKPYLVPYQWFSPETNLYEYQSNQKRYENYGRPGISLPFYGEWMVNQGHNGDVTHKKDWKDAWDFVIIDEAGRSYSGQGDVPGQYYCFGKPVIAPADGEVVAVVADVEDNAIGTSNIKENWGNSVVIKHTDFLYSQVSHLKYQSIDVKTGELVRKGQQLGLCGNSGRSPYPHIHFQLQGFSQIGSPTIPYPIDHYLVKGSQSSYQFYEIPRNQQVIAGLIPETALVNAFAFQPGQSIHLKLGEKDFEWNIGVNEWNDSFISDGISQAFFKNDGAVFQFTSFRGNQHTPLFDVYKVLYRVPLIFDKDLIVEDQFPLYILDRSLVRYLYDFIAPFVEWRGIIYRLKYIEKDTKSQGIILRSNVAQKGLSGKQESYKTIIGQGKLLRIEKMDGSLRIDFL